MGSGGHVPVSAMLQSAYEKLSTPMSDGTDHSKQLAAQASLFLAGRMTDHLGAFIQVTGTGDHGTLKVGRLSMDNADVRYANNVTLGGKSVLLGLSVNNSPTVSDAFNTVPAWRFPYIGPGLAGPGATPLIDGGLAQQVLGVDAYAFVDNAWYAELGGYGGLPRSFLEHANVLAPEDAYNKLSGVNPYWRLAYMGSLGGGNISAGIFGMNARVTPDGMTGTDKYTDIGIDGSYQIEDGKENVFALNGAFIHEKAKFDSSNPGVSDTLHRLDLNASYHFHKTYGLTLGLFNVGGSADAALYGVGADTGFADGSPDSAGYILQADWTPFGKSDSWGQPWANLRLGLQYTWYTKFNGAKTNYDGNGRNASDNNTLLAFLWTSF